MMDALFASQTCDVALISNNQARLKGLRIGDPSRTLYLEEARRTGRAWHTFCTSPVDGLFRELFRWTTLAGGKSIRTKTERRKKRRSVKGYKF